MPPETRRTPTSFRELTPAECMNLLARNRIGRLAFTFHDRVDIQPLNYVMIGGDLVFRTVPGTKVDVLQHHPWVAFEVDELDGVDAWYSVVVRGTIYPIDEIGNADDRKAYLAAVERVGVPEKGAVLLRLHTDNVTGREARVGDSLTG